MAMSNTGSGAGAAAVNHRARAIFFAGVTIIAASLALVLVIALSNRYHARNDLSVVGGQRLAERTLRMLGRLEGQYRIVIAAELSAADRRAKDRLTDVLEEMRRTGDHLEYTLLDTNAPAGVRDYQKLVANLVAQDAVTFRDQAASIEVAGGGAAALSMFMLDTLSPKLLEIESTISPAMPAGKANRDYFSQTAAAVRIAAKDLSDHAGQSSDALKAKLGAIALPRTDLAAAALVAVLEPAIAQLGEIATELKRFGEIRTEPGAESAKALAPQVQQRRDQVSVVLDTIKRMKRPDLLRVVDVLSAGSAALIIGPKDKGVCAIDVAALLPSTAWLDASGAAKADQNRRVEELVASGLASLLNPVRPIVVLVHGEMREFLNDVPILALARQRLEMRGIDLLEWACVVAPLPPRLTDIDPDRNRPVVYLIMSADSAAGSGAGNANQQAAGLSGVQRSEKLGAVVAKLVDEGANVLLSLNPSVAPTYGGKDPLAAAMAKFGMSAESGRPVLREAMNGGVRIVETDQLLQPDDAEHALNPIGEAVKGLPTAFAWPIAIFERPDLFRPDDNVTVTSLYSVPVSPGTWLESQWLRLWQTPRDQRAMLTDAPKFEEGRDVAKPGAGTRMMERWMVAAAAQRPLTQGRTQRMVVVGTNSWLIDQVAARQATIDGRRVMANPGNMELLDASVYYLAGQDELIAQSATSRAAAMIVPIDQAKLGRIRLAIVAGLPAIALLMGLLVRWWRG